MWISRLLNMLWSYVEQGKQNNGLKDAIYGGDELFKASVQNDVEVMNAEDPLLFSTHQALRGNPKAYCTTLAVILFMPQ